MGYSQRDMMQIWWFLANGHLLQVSLQSHLLDEKGKSAMKLGAKRKSPGIFIAEKYPDKSQIAERVKVVLFNQSLP